MLTIHQGHGGRAAPREWQPTIAMRPAALLATLTAASIAVNASIIIADGHLRQPSSAAGDCATISQQADRLACYDSRAHRPAPHPFKGANALTRLDYP
jgi:hypothetical protein